uniref:Thioredoxin domain containing 16 n=1 Tax=Sphenodon punctatus TaxID=8508 RepID=A0A8D0GLV0_SPHPU
MSLEMTRWACGVAFLLLCGMTTASGAGVLTELGPQEYFESSQPGKASLVYFGQDGECLFVLRVGAGAVLQDYGISVVKVNGTIVYFPMGRWEVVLGCLLTFISFPRGSVLLREFPTDALFDVNAIVANVLFALLFNEVKYITTLAELQKLEDALRGRLNLVFAYVPAVGTPEHRAVMEAAFVYGTMHQFVLTTERMLSRNSDALSSRLLFCHCKAAVDPAQPCQRTLMEQPLTTLNIHTYLKLMEAPVVTEVAEDPEKVSTIHLQLGLPLIFILSQKETYEMDKRTAEFVAWQLVGKAGVALLSRYLKEGKLLPTFYTDEIIALVKENLQSKPIPEEEEEEEDKDNNDVQDDQVVESVYRDRKRELPLELVRVLTEETFNAALTETDHTVVLFYASWEAVSLALLQSYLEVAAKLKGTGGISLARVNCWDWPNVCTQQNATRVPVIKTYKQGGRALTYAGMLGAEELQRFIVLSSVSCPLELATVEEAEEYLSGRLHPDLSPYRRVSVLGIFDSSMKEAIEAFIEAGTVLNGHVTTGMYYEDDVLPEITVANLPEYFSLEKPFLILFSDGDVNERAKEEMLRLVKGKPRRALVACWLNLKNTPVGRGILKAYFQTPPPLPLLVWADLHSRGQVFAFPSDHAVTETNVLAWLEKLKAGLEIPSGKCPGDDAPRDTPPNPILTCQKPSQTNRSSIAI